MSSDVGGPPQAVEVEALSITYKVRPVVEAVSLIVEPGEMVVVLGPSGSGKSSLVMSVAGLLPPTAGTVMVGTTDLYALTERKRDAFRRHRVGLVTQAGDLVPELNVVENVALPLRILGRPAEESKERAVAELRRFEVESLADSDIDRISGGQQQRVAIARALVHRPVLLLADEPTASLDAKNAQRVVAELAEYATEHRVPVLVATHDTRFEAQATRTFEIDDGHLKAS